VIRRMRPQELPQVAGLLARAFYDDPAMSWTFPRHRKRMRQAERFWRIRLTHMAPQDEIYVTDDLSAVAAWTPPDRWHVSLRETRQLASMMLNLRLPMLFRGLQRLERAHPHAPPHFYLAVIGTDPSRQGEGLGTALLQPVLEICDRDGVPAYLESSKERNVDFYSRFGFRVRQEVRLPGGPPMWPMWRDAPAG
jgi:GNAT superfamily N-acetyltransferase